MDYHGLSWTILDYTYNESPGKIDPSSHIAHVLKHLHPCPGLEHNDDVGLVQDPAGGVHGHPLEVLHLLRISVKKYFYCFTEIFLLFIPVKVDGSSVHNHVHTISPLSVRLSNSNLNRRGEIILGSHCG